MFLEFEKNQTIAELGVFEGAFSKEIYKISKPKNLYLVDLFSGYFGSGDKDGKNHHYVQLEDEYGKLIKYFSNDRQVKIIRDSTINYLNGIDDNSLDVVYIDADHSCTAVKNDLYASLPKVRNGGFICGHDYVIGTDVELAVNEFCNKTKLKIAYLTMDGCPSYCIKK